MLTIDIKMNDVLIGQATAAHTEEIKGEGVGTFRKYNATMWYRDRDGYLYEAEWDIWGHRPGDGAVTLGERLLKEGRHRLKRKVPDGISD